MVVKAGMQLVILLISFVIFSCNSRDKTEIHEWQGNPQAIEVVEKMFSEIGDRDSWAELKSVYLHLKQRDGIFGPNESRKFIDLEKEKLILDQKVDENRYVKILNGDNAWLIGNSDSLIVMNPLNKAVLKEFAEENFYVHMRRLAEGKNIKLAVAGKKIVVLDRDSYLFAFELNDEFRPYKYYLRARVKSASKDLLQIFNDWGEKNGMIYPSAGRTDGEIYTFSVKDIKLSKDNAEQAFNIDFNPGYVIDDQNLN